MLSHDDKSILILEKFFDNFIKDFQGVLDIKFNFDPYKIFNPEENIYLLSVMVHYKYFIDKEGAIELAHASVYQWSYMDIFASGTHYLCDKNGEVVSYEDTKNYIKQVLPQGFKNNFFTSPIEINYLELKILASKIKEYESLSNSLTINEGDEKEIIKV
jgi:hypothetical protein